MSYLYAGPLWLISAGMALVSHQTGLINALAGIVDMIYCRSGHALYAATETARRLKIEITKI